MLNGGSIVACVLQALTEQILSISIVGLQCDYFLQQFGRPFWLVFLFCRQSEEIERTGIIRLESNGGFQFLPRIAILAGFEVEASQVVMRRGELGIKSRRLGKLLESPGSVELIDQSDPQIEMSLSGIRRKGYGFLEALHGVRSALGFTLEHSQGSVGIGIVGSHLNGRAKLLLCLREPCLLCQEKAEVDV